MAGVRVSIGPEVWAAEAGMERVVEQLGKGPVKAAYGKHTLCRLAARQNSAPAPGSSRPGLSHYSAAPSLPVDTPFAATRGGKPKPLKDGVCPLSRREGHCFPGPRAHERGSGEEQWATCPCPGPVRLQDRVKPSFLRARHGPVSRKWLGLPRETRVHERFLFYGLGEVHV